jgi:hypothetical protein
MVGAVWEVVNEDLVDLVSCWLQSNRKELEDPELDILILVVVVDG